MIRKFYQKSASTEHINKQFNDRRQINWVPLAPPDYLIESTYLIESFIERECLYVGTLSNIATDLNLKKRAEVLNIIDNGRNTKKLASPCVDCILSLSAQDIRLTHRVFPEDIILRISTDKIISAAYIRDNDSHFLIVLFIPGNAPDSMSGNMTIIKTETSVNAEEICSIITQCFQILYTEATLRHLDRQLCSTISHSACEYSPDLILGFRDRRNIEQQDDCRTLNDIDSVYSELSASKVDLLQAYMLRLQQVLNQDEMKQFASSLAAWQKGCPFESFCETTQQLLGPLRIGLLADMRPFVDQADRFTLEQFINEYNSPTKSRSPYNQLLAKSPLPIQMQRSLSYASTSNGVLSINDEENSLRDDLSSSNRNTFSNEFEDEFSKNIDTLFQKVGNLDLILSGDR